MLDNAALILGSPIAAIIGVTLFAMLSLSSIRALDSLCALIREKRPDQWATRGDYGLRVSPGDPPAVRYRWISWLVLGFISLMFRMTIIALCYGPPENAR
ncbi:MAG TPA: hypothetical protein VKB67_08770 [Rhizomicrobium sp.]|nr:hypothetical protein [Rhizomicrobium sp.]